MDKVRMGIIGMGVMGSSHAHRIGQGDIERVDLTAVCDADPARTAAFGNYRVFTDPRELIESGEVDAVLIATPHYSHTTIGIAALQAGLHVLVEKPISVHKADAERLIAAHQGPHQVFAAMFNQRPKPAFTRAKKLIENGELGELYRVSWIVTDWFRSDAYYASGGWRATWKGEGGGVLLNQCPHQLDLFQWLCGMPVKVRAFCLFGADHDIEVEDRVTAYLEYPNGATGIFVTATGEAPGTNRLEICGERGRMVIDARSMERIEFFRNEVPMSEFRRTTDKTFSRVPHWDVSIPVGKRTGSPHNVIIKNFAEAILDGAPLIAPAAEGLNSVELANAMIYSSLEDTTVELPLDGEGYEAALKRLIADSETRKR